MEPPSVSRWEVRAIVCLVAIVAAALVCLAFTVGVTVDEPSHLLSAHLYWQGRDTLDPGDMPPLIKIVGGWVPHLAGIQLPAADHSVWKTNHEWLIANELVTVLTAEETVRLFGWSRVPFVVFPLASLLLIWWWSRQIHGPLAAILAAVLFAMTPMVLGHGALFKNDGATSFSLLLFGYRCWRLWVDCSFRNAMWIAGAVLLGVLSKFSLLLLPPLGFVAVVVCCLRARRVEQLLPMSLAGSILLWVGIVAAWQFDVSPVPAAEIQQWGTYPNTPRWFFEAAQLGSHLPIPGRFWRGFWNLAASNGGTDSIYFLGEIHSQAQPHYFVVAYLLKTPFALLLMTALGLALTARRGIENLFWLLPGLLYAGLASISNLQLGLRLVLPAIVCFSMAPGVAADWILRQRWHKPAVALLLLLTALPVAMAYPHFIPYCNLAAGREPGAPVWFFSDSNLDWGQSLPPLAKYLQEHPEIGKVRLFYFGAGWPGKWIPDERHELLAPPWAAEWAKGPVYEPQPGYYAISATLLTGQLFDPPYRAYFARFRDQKPIAAPGGSMLIYRIP